MEKKGTKWGWIIFWLFLFWPVGLFLLIKKLATDKSALMSGKTGALSVIGWLLLIVGSMALFGELSGSPDGYSLIILLIFIAGGVLLLRKASKTKKTAARYKKYIDIVVNQNVRSIDNVVSAVGLSYDAVVKDLQDMINIGYLKDAYIHLGNREIIMRQQESVVYAQGAYAGQSATQTKAVRCPGCGANNVVTVGRVSECEYCSTPINT